MIISRGVTKIQKRLEKVVKASPDLRIRKQSSQKPMVETPFQMNGNGGTICLLGEDGEKGRWGKGREASQGKRW